MGFRSGLGFSEELDALNGSTAGVHEHWLVILAYYAQGWSCVHLRTAIAYAHHKILKHQAGSCSDPVSPTLRIGAPEASLGGLEAGLHGCQLPLCRGVELQDRLSVPRTESTCQNGPGEHFVLSSLHVASL